MIKQLAILSLIAGSITPAQASANYGQIGTQHVKKGLEMYDAMPKRIVNGEYIFKDYDFEKVKQQMFLGLNALNKAVKVDPENPSHWVAAGFAYYVMDNNRQSCEAFRAAKTKGFDAPPEVKQIENHVCSRTHINGPRVVQSQTQFSNKRNNTVSGMSPTYNHIEKTRKAYAEKCNDYRGMRYYHFNKCTGRYERSDTFDQRFR